MNRTRLRYPLFRILEDVLFHSKIHCETIRDDSKLLDKFSQKIIVQKDSLLGISFLINFCKY